MNMCRLADVVDARLIARGTPGFSGADLANLDNEAALFAARENHKAVEHRHFELAKDKIMMGAERRSMAMSENEKRLTAYHEAEIGRASCGKECRSRWWPNHEKEKKKRREGATA